jgi:hypothetical protein
MGNLHGKVRTAQLNIIILMMQLQEQWKAGRRCY